MACRSDFSHDAEKDVSFFWYDAYENEREFPGQVFLFGLVPSAQEGGYTSCCVAVGGMERNLYILPRKDFTLQDAKKEFENIASQHRVSGYGIRTEEKEYVFSKEGGARKDQYLHIVYPSTFFLSSDQLKSVVFHHVFGVNASLVELFKLENDITGPCWLLLKNATLVRENAAKQSHCAAEFAVSMYTGISRHSSGTMPLPRLTATSIRVHVKEDGVSKTDCVAMISCVTHQNKISVDGITEDHSTPSHFRVFSLAGDVSGSIDAIVPCATERDLVSAFVQYVSETDPDFLVGHDLLSRDLDILFKRLYSLSPVDVDWSAFGKLKWKQLPALILGNAGETMPWTLRRMVSGRVIVDTCIAAKEHIKQITYELHDLARETLHVSFDELQDNATVNQTAGHLLMFAHLSFGIMFHLMLVPLAMEISLLCGSTMAKSLSGGRAARVESLLVGEFHKRGFILPDKERSMSKAESNAYAGGLVLEPEKGLFDTHVLLLDFNSLYPSIIQEYNICFTTTAQTDTAETAVPGGDKEPGVIPTVVGRLVLSRRRAKEQMQAETDTVKQMQINVQQLALKITANSIYGCLGFSNSRFYAKHLASLVTSLGRKMLSEAVEFVKQMGYTVLYGDTDSIMVDTRTRDYPAVLSLGKEITAAVNKNRRHIELGLDGVFEKIILYKKKKYAAVVLSRNSDGAMTRKLETKGLDLVRRDWCPLSKKAGVFLIESVLFSAREDAYGRVEKYMQETRERIEAWEPGDALDDYVITKCLAKHIKEYNAPLPCHVQLASTLASQGKHIRPGQHIAYVMCVDTKNSAETAAYSAEQVVQSGGRLVIDKRWYLEHQIVPSVSRLCENLDGFDQIQRVFSAAQEKTEAVAKEQEKKKEIYVFDFSKEECALNVKTVVSLDALFAECRV
jgi:DNA polymerase alpha subunit A